MSTVLNPPINYPAEVEVTLKIRIKDFSDYEHVTSTDPATSLGTDLAYYLEEACNYELIEYNKVKVSI